MFEIVSISKTTALWLSSPGIKSPLRQKNYIFLDKIRAKYAGPVK